MKWVICLNYWVICSCDSKNVFFFLQKSGFFEWKYSWPKSQLSSSLIKKFHLLQQILQNHRNIFGNLFFTGRPFSNWWSIAYRFIQQIACIVHVLMIVCMIKWNISQWKVFDWQFWCICILLLIRFDKILLHCVQSIVIVFHYFRFVCSEIVMSKID